MNIVHLLGGRIARPCAKVLCSGIAIAFAINVTVKAETIALWEFETNTPDNLSNSATSPSIAADLYTGVGAAIASGLHVSANTDWSTPAGNGSANSFNSNTWAIGDYYQFTLATTNFQEIHVSWDQTRSSTGPELFDFAYSLDGTTFTTFLDDYSVGTRSWSSGSATTASSFTADLSGLSALDNAASITFRLIAAGDPTGTGGTNRIDNFLVTGSILTSSGNSLFWDANGTAAGLGGSGSWNGSNWATSNTGTGSVQVFETSKKAVFSGAGGDVVIDTADVTVDSGLQFDADQYTISAAGGRKLTLSGTGPSISVTDADHSATISAEVAGAGFTKSGGGTLILTNQSNSYTGPTSVSAGVLEVSHNAQLGASDADINLLGGTLKATTVITFGANRELTGAGSIDTAARATFDGPINAAALTFTNSGSIVFGNSSQSVGNLTFTAGRTDSTPLLDTIGNVLNLTGNLTAEHTTGVVRIGGYIDVGGSNRTFTTSDSDAAVDLVLDGTISGSGRIQLAGPVTSVIQLNSDNSGHTGGFRMNAGAPKVLLGHENALGMGQLFLNGGTLETLTDLTIPTAASLGGNATLSGEKSITFTGDIALYGTSAKTLTVDTTVVFSGNFGTEGSSIAGLTFAGSGSVALTSGANGLGGPLSVDGPSVSLSGILNVAEVSVPKGTLTIQGSLPFANLTVGDGEEEDSTFILGDTIGVLDVISLTLASDATFKLQIDSTAGRSDTLTIYGGAALGNGVAKLELTDLGSAILAAGTEFTLIENLSIFPVDGYFKGMPHLSQFTVGLNQFEIDYGGAEFEAPDIILRVIPEPGAATLLLTGLAIFSGFRRRRTA